MCNFTIEYTLTATEISANELSFHELEEGQYEKALATFDNTTRQIELHSKSAQLVGKTYRHYFNAIVDVDPVY